MPHTSSLANKRGQTEPVQASQPLIRASDSTRERSIGLLPQAEPDGPAPEPVRAECRIREILEAMRKKRTGRLKSLATQAKNTEPQLLAAHHGLVNTLLIASALHIHADWATTALRWGADVDAVVTAGRHAGQTALMIAAGKGDLALMQILVKHGASVGKLDEVAGRWHALLVAAYCLRPDAVKWLVDSTGVSADHPNVNGWTALKMVLETSHGRTLTTEQSLKRNAIIRFLVGAKADPLAECEHDESFAALRAYHRNPLAEHTVECEGVDGECVYPSNSASPLELARNDETALEAILLGNPEWLPTVIAAPFFIVLENLVSTREGAKAGYLAFRDRYAEDRSGSRKLAQAYIDMRIND